MADGQYNKSVMVYCMDLEDITCLHITKGAVLTLGVTDSYLFEINLEQEILINPV